VAQIAIELNAQNIRTASTGSSSARIVQAIIFDTCPALTWSMANTVFRSGAADIRVGARIS